MDDTVMSFDGEQHGVLIEGELELRLGGELIKLPAGDSYSHYARIPHHARNITDKPATLIWAVSPVVIPQDVIETDEGDPARD
ncbi:MAG: cupin domain-containing protein [Pseudomonadota bacterium]